MWGGLGAMLTGLVGVSTGLGLDAAVFAALIVGLLCQPLGHTLLWLAEQPGVRDYLNRDRGDAGNRFSITIGCWTWPPPPPRPSRPAVKPAPPMDPAPGWFLRGPWVVTGVLLAAWPLLTFMADAAHELRSPLAALKLQVQGLQRAPDDATRERALDIGLGLRIGDRRYTRGAHPASLPFPPIA